MPIQPTPGDVHVNRPLTNISLAFAQEASNFVASRAFPVVSVDKQSDAYFVYPLEYWTNDEMKMRGPATESVGAGYEISTTTYYAKVWAIHRDIPDQLRANQDSPINVDREATEFVTAKALIKREKLFVATYMATGIWTYDYDGVVSSPSTNQVLQWNDANSDPIGDIQNAKTSILSLTGFEPNTLTVGYPVHSKLVNHPDIIARLNSGQTPGGPALANERRIAEILGVETYTVMKAIENTAQEGQAKSMSFIGGKKALLTYAPSRPGLMTPSAGYIFAWTGLMGATAEGYRIKRFRMEPIASDRVEIEMAFDMKLVSADLGAFFDTIIA